MKSAELQWGGRFAHPPDPELMAFGSSLEDDLVLAPFDVRCSLAHVSALASGGIITASIAAALREALQHVGSEIADHTFATSARASGAEDIHGAIDARVRELSGEAGEWLHAGRSRNDQVATTLLLYARDRAAAGAATSLEIVTAMIASANEELKAGTTIAATTHWQPAQPTLLAFWIMAAAEPFLRAARRFKSAEKSASRFCPLGSAAVAGSTLPLGREVAAAELSFSQPSRNAIDAIGTRDVLLDTTHAFVRAVTDASRIAGELVIWCTPQFGYARLGDASSTGSSLMPQKRNPDPFELIRGVASEVLGAYTGAVASVIGLPLSYHRDLQQTKRLATLGIERGLAALQAFALALSDVAFVRAKMNADADGSCTVATDVADALILGGVSARRAHELVGLAVTRAEKDRRPLNEADFAWLANQAGVKAIEAPLDATASVRAKQTSGSTNPDEVVKMIRDVEAEVRSLDSARSEKS